MIIKLLMTFDQFDNDKVNYGTWNVIERPLISHVKSCPEIIFLFDNIMLYYIDESTYIDYY